MIRHLLALLFPGGRRGRLTILIFHRVLPAADELFPAEAHAQSFERQCIWLRRWFRVLPLDEAVQLLKVGRLPSRAVAITFDDGYADNHDQALPILQKHGLCATFFIATDYLDGGRMWNDSVIEALRRTALRRVNLQGLGGGVSLGELDLRTPAERRHAIDVVLKQIKYLEPAHRLQVTKEIAARAQVELPLDLMMSSAQVNALYRAGMQIGAHTATHPILAQLDAAAAREEIMRSKTYLEQVIEAPVQLFAYPNGKPTVDYTRQTVDVVRELGFSAAVSTAWGAASSGNEDLLQLPRFTPWDRSAWRFLLRMWRNAYRQAVVRV